MSVSKQPAHTLSTWFPPAHYPRIRPTENGIVALLGSYKVAQVLANLVQLLVSGSLLGKFTHFARTAQSKQHASGTPTAIWAARPINKPLFIVYDMF